MILISKRIWTGETVAEYRPCRICHGLSKSKCGICQQQLKPVQKMSPVEFIRYEAHRENMIYLEGLYLKLKNLKLLSSGCDTLDRKIILNFGAWFFMPNGKIHPDFNMPKEKIT